MFARRTRRGSKTPRCTPADIRGPFPHGEDQFAVFAKYEVTPRSTGKRTTMEEVAVYTIKNGKIIDEKFFYGT